MRRVLLLAILMLAMGMGSVMAATDEQIEQSVRDYCASMGHPARVDATRDTCTGSNRLGVQVVIKDTDLMVSGRAKSVTDQVMRYISSFNEVSATCVFAQCDDGTDNINGDYTVCLHVYSCWNREEGQY